MVVPPTHHGRRVSFIQGAATGRRASDMGRTRAAAASSSSSSSAAAAAAASSGGDSGGAGAPAPQKPLERHLAALAGVAEESAGLRDGGLKGLDRKAATQRVQGMLGALEAAYRHMQKLATPEAQEADEGLAVRVRDGKRRRKELVAAVGVLRVAQAAAAAVADGERNRRSSTAVVAAVNAALETAAESVEGGAATVEELRELLDQTSDAADAIEAIRDQVGAGGDWVFSGYRPMEALGLLGEMAAWLRNALAHCGLRDTVQQLQTRVDKLREARVDKYDEGFRVANGLRIKAKGLSEEGRIARKDYKSLHAALEFADLKYQSHLMNEAEIKRRLALLTEEEDDEDEDDEDAPPAKASPAKGKGGKGKARAASKKRVTRGGGGGASSSSSAAASATAAKREKKGAEAGSMGLVKYLPSNQRDAVLALVEAASGKGSKGGKGVKGKGKQAAPKAVALKPLCAQHLGYNPNPSSSSSSADGTPSKQRRSTENPFRTVLHVVDAIIARLNRDCGRSGGAGGLKKRKGGPGGEDEEPYTIKRPKAVNSEQRQRRRWDVPETKRLLRGIVKFWQDGFRWRRIKEWDGRKGDKARLTHRNNLDLCEKSRSLLEKWEKEEGKTVDRDEYPTWAETLMHDEARLLRYCGGGGNSEE